MDLNTAVYVGADGDIKGLADKITSEILTKCESELIYKITLSEFYDFPDSRKEEIYNTALKNSLPDEENVLNTMYYNRRRALIEESAQDYLSDNSFMIINGFVNFRLQEYKNELKKLCHNAAQEVSAQHEYNDFLDMLRFFVSVQAPKENAVHIIKKSGALRVFNKRHRDVTDFYFDEFAFSCEDFTEDDILLSTLITISPQKIIIHDKKENRKIYQTLESVFPEVQFI